MSEGADWSRSGSTSVTTGVPAAAAPAAHRHAAATSATAKMLRLGPVQRSISVGQPLDSLVNLIGSDSRVSQPKGVLAAFEQEVGALHEHDAAVLCGREQC